MERRTRRLRSRHTKVGVLVLLALALATTAALAAPGDLDTSFDGDGTRTIDYGGYDFASAVLVQPDGKLLLTGSGNPGQDFIVTRLNRDGSTDASFDNDGMIAWDFIGSTDVASDAAQHADGRIVVVGNTYLPGPRATTAVLQLMPDGSPDYGFGSVGRVTLDYGGNDTARSVVVQPDGKIVFAGQGNSNTNFLVGRLNPDGSPDPTFDGDGNVAIDFGGSDSAEAAALQADGKIVIAGQTTAGADTNLTVVRLNPNGSPDASFAGDGSRTIDNGATEDASAVLVQPDGKIVLAGSVGDDMAVTRLNADGSSDSGFGGDGRMDVDFSGTDRIFAAVLQANGKILVAGAFGYTPLNGASEGAAIARLQPGGALDTTFSGDGKRPIQIGTGATAQAVALQDNGRIVVSGEAREDANVKAFVARLDGESAASGGGPADGPGGGAGGGGGGGDGVRVPRCNGKRATIVGSSRSDRLKGTRRADVIVALGGNDKIAAGRGNDLICAGSGNDSIDGGSGNDRLYGQSGKDKLGGGSGKDSLSGGDGKDNLSGGGGRDKLSGGAGRDKQRQ